MNKKHNNTDHRLAHHFMLHRTDQKISMQRKKQRDSCLVQRVPRSVCSNFCASITARHPYSELPNEIRAVTDATWAGELEGLRSTSCGWIYFGDHLMETYSATQQIVALSTAESEYISISKGATHALEVRSAMVEFGLTSNVVCETDVSAGRAMATRHGVGRVRHVDARLLWLQQLRAEDAVQVRAKPGEHNETDLGTKMVDLRRMTSLLKRTLLRPPMGRSPWMVAATLTAVAEATKDFRVLIWNVKNMYETSGWFWRNGQCYPDGAVGQTACESHWTDD